MRKCHLTYEFSDIHIDAITMSLTLKSPILGMIIIYGVNDTRGKAMNIINE